MGDIGSDVAGHSATTHGADEKGGIFLKLGEFWLSRIRLLSI
jgi:hypothetical protein